MRRVKFPHYAPHTRGSWLAGRGSFAACRCCPFRLSDQPSEYAILLASLKAGNTDIDYTRLRLSYMDSPEYKAAKDTSESEKAMIEELNKKDYPAALKDAEIVLDSEYVNIDAHFVACVANREMGATDKAEFHRTVFRGLIDSILNSGDGKSPEKAWVVINVHEEYVVPERPRFHAFTHATELDA